MADKSCPICGKTFIASGRAKYCSPVCAKEGEKQARKAWIERTDYRDKQRQQAHDNRHKKAEANRGIIENLNKKKTAEQKRQDTIRRKKELKELEAAAIAGDIDAQMDLAKQNGDLETYYTLYKEKIIARDREFNIYPGKLVNLYGHIDVYRPDFVEAVLAEEERLEREELEEYIPKTIKRGEPMLTIICGLIGSGKTTYAKKNYQYITDLDDMPLYTQKSAQISQTLKMLSSYGNVAHITCFPTEEEYLAFKDLKPKYLWINTSFDQAKSNILARNRPRDMADLKRVLDRNVKYLNQVKRSTIGFQTINIF